MSFIAKWGCLAGILLGVDKDLSQPIAKSHDLKRCPLILTVLCGAVLSSVILLTGCASIEAHDDPRALDPADLPQWVGEFKPQDHADGERVVFVGEGPSREQRHEARYEAIEDAVRHVAAYSGVQLRGEAIQADRVREGGTADEGFEVRAASRFDQQIGVGGILDIPLQIEDVIYERGPGGKYIAHVRLSADQEEIEQLRERQQDIQAPDISLEAARDRAFDRLDGQRAGEVDEKLWEEAQEADKAEGYARYLEGCPTCEHEEEAEQAIAEIKDSELWQRAQEEDDRHGYGVYLSECELCEQQQQAEVRLAEIEEQRLWEETQDAQSVSAYERYLAQCSTCEHEREAQQAIANLRATEATGMRPQGEGTVVDPETGLEWQRCAVGQEWNPQEEFCEGEAEEVSFERAQALAHNAARSPDGGGWRVPEVEELLSIVYCGDAAAAPPERDERCSDLAPSPPSPTLDSEAFTDAPEGHFWSGSRYEAFSGHGWVVSFESGRAFWSDEGQRGYVRLVREAQ